MLYSQNSIFNNLFWKGGRSWLIEGRDASRTYPRPEAASIREAVPSRAAGEKSAATPGRSANRPLERSTQCCTTLVRSQARAGTAAQAATGQCDSTMRPTDCRHVANADRANVRSIDAVAKGGGGENPSATFASLDVQLFQRHEDIDEPTRFSIDIVGLERKHCGERSPLRPTTRPHRRSVRIPSANRCFL